MKTIIISVLLAMLTFSVSAQDTVFKNKTMICLDANELIANAKENGLVPLLGAMGQSFNGNVEEGSYEVFYLVVYNAEQGNYSFIEFTKDGEGCLLGGGWNDLIFDPAEIDNQIGWE